ncbi:FecR family protein [Variovorax terrae]|uniref:FecR family protein n=1 Tax=Variovorax terrae TaxID=2923278 RepID=A0A9X1VU87_9BURK|nr:FecR domain-containing protein [Variovorax terrae]MCJ0763422.1 FecR family protein [Variovorax terrae]
MNPQHAFPLRLRSRAAALACALLLAAPAVLAQAVGTATHVAGVAIARTPSGAIRLLSPGSEIRQGDTLVTEASAYLRMRFTDHAEMVVSPKSEIRITEYRYDPNRPELDRQVIDLQRGGFRAVTGELGKRNHEAVVFNTPEGTIGVRGTHLGALFCQNDCGNVPTPTGKTPDNGLHVDVASGAVVVTPNLQSALPGANLGLPSLPGTPSPAAAPMPGAGAPAPVVILNAGQFGYLPPPQNGVQPPLILVPPPLAVQVRMPQSISQNNPQSSASNVLDCEVR